MGEATTTQDFDLDAIRQDFPILSRTLPNGQPVTYLDTAASAQKPRSVIDAESRVYQEHYANAYRGVYEFGAQVDDGLEATREKVRALVNAASADEIIFSPGTTMSINMIALGWGRSHLSAGDEVLVNVMEHHANLVPWQQVAIQQGATLKYLPLTDAGQLDLSQLDDFVSDRTRVIAVTGMSNVLGTVTELETLAAKAHSVGAILAVDGAQSVPHEITDVQKTGIDFLTFSGHKLYGPSGVGILYGRRELLDAMEPMAFGGHMIAEVYRDHSTWAAPPAKFEAGTLPIAQAIALGTAVDYVQQIGFPAMCGHEHQLLEYAHQRLTAIPGLKIHGPPVEHKGAIVSFTIDGAHPEDLAQLLNRRGVFVRHGHHCTMPLHEWLGVSATVRASFGVYNTVGDIDVLYDALEFARGKLRLT